MKRESGGRSLFAGVQVACSFAALVLIVVVWGGCGSQEPVHSETISQADFDGTWPFKVSGGLLRCVPGDQHPPLGAVVFKVGGTSYAVNGAALDSGYPPISPIRDKDHSRLGDVILEGTSLCPNLGP